LELFLGLDTADQGVLAAAVHSLLKGGGRLSFTDCILTINVPLILKVRDIISFSWAKHIMGHFAGFFEGAETLFILKLS
jgi:hypothetical protein